MVRLVVQIVDRGDACQVGGPVNVEFKTFDIDHPAIEHLLQSGLDPRMYRTGSIIGAEVIPAAEAEKGK